MVLQELGAHCPHRNMKCSWTKHWESRRQSASDLGVKSCAATCADHGFLGSQPGASPFGNDLPSRVCFPVMICAWIVRLVLSQLFCSAASRTYRGSPCDLHSAIIVIGFPEISAVKTMSGPGIAGCSSRRTVIYNIYADCEPMARCPVDFYAWLDWKLISKVRRPVRRRQTSNEIQGFETGA
jgi:hypothetical protein